MIKVITDSTTYLPTEFITSHNIEVVPLKVRFGNEVYDEGIGISNDTFYEKLATESVFPKTSQPPVGEFKLKYEEILNNDNDEVLVLTISSGLSGTFNSAKTAADMLPKAKITVFDSKSTALGLGLMVATAVDLADTGHSMPEIMARLEQMRQDMHVYFMVDTLEYLYKGGRIGAVSAFIGGLLKFKPILTIDEGVLKPQAKVRTRTKAIKRLINIAQESIPDTNTPVQIAVMHIQSEPDIARLEKLMRKQFHNINRFVTGEIGPVIGAHTGPGLLGICVCPDAYSIDWKAIQHTPSYAHSNATK